MILGSGFASLGKVDSFVKVLSKQPVTAVTAYLIRSYVKLKQSRTSKAKSFLRLLRQKTKPFVFDYSRCLVQKSKIVFKTSYRPTCNCAKHLFCPFFSRKVPKITATPNVLRLPAYSPDLNPIEISFSKLKSILRKAKIRDVGVLQEFLRQSPCLFTPSECGRYIQHAGYASTNN